MSEQQIDTKKEVLAALDVVIVGAGFSGLYMLHCVRKLNLSVRLFEGGSDVGGAWYWNRYPGARCDIESLEYSYSFDEDLQREWKWTERYASQPEISRYLSHVADRFDLRRDITFDTRVISSVFDESTDLWRIGTDKGETVMARYCIMATGSLSAAKKPDMPGLSTFQGSWYQTSNWPQEAVDFRGKQVGVIGTGSSGIQIIPVIAETAERVVVFQRTPNFSVPTNNAPLDPACETFFKEHHAEVRDKLRYSFSGTFADPNPLSFSEMNEEEQLRELESRWHKGGAMRFYGTFSDLMVDSKANKGAADFVRGKIREIVKDPAKAAILTPNDYPIGAKRLPANRDYFATYNRDNVSIVDLRSAPIETITPRGITTHDGEYELDIIVFATGFDAMTGALLRMDIRGRNGIRLADKWADGPISYLGLMVSGFPNLFTVLGPGSPSVLSNNVVSIEQHVEWIRDCMAHMKTRDIAQIEPDPAAEKQWVAHVNQVADSTLFPQASSWYTGANVPGKPRVFMPYAGGVGAYRRKCEEIAVRRYEGFLLATHGTAIYL